MVRKVLALLVASALGVGVMNAASAAQDPAPPKSAAPSVAAYAASKPERSPLPPGQPAGIKQAQGISQTAWHVVGIGFIAGVALAMILIDGDDPSAPGTTN